MIKEVIVVEGRSDIAAVQRAVDADCIATGGYSRLRSKLPDIEAAYKKRGIIILTDPDAAGERIRAFLAKRFPQAKHAFIPKELAKADGDIGVECAPAAVIAGALKLTHYTLQERREEFSMNDLVSRGLSGTDDSARDRRCCSELLGLGICNARQFLKRLNDFGISREQFCEALASVRKETDDEK